MNLRVALQGQEKQNKVAKDTSPTSSYHAHQRQQILYYSLWSRSGQKQKYVGSTGLSYCIRVEFFPSPAPGCSENDNKWYYISPLLYLPTKVHLVKDTMLVVSCLQNKCSARVGAGLGRVLSKVSPHLRGLDRLLPAWVSCSSSCWAWNTPMAALSFSLKQITHGDTRLAESDACVGIKNMGLGWCFWAWVSFLFFKRWF